jgi:hypothetical protein
VRLSAAGRVAARESAETAFAAARAIERALADADGDSRAAILASAWSCLAARGDLSVVLLAEDGGGVDATASGIGAWWGMNEAGATVPFTLPSEAPGTIPVHPATVYVVGAPAELTLGAPTRDDLATRCGVHP